jgi:hypothetical protein
MYLSSTTRGYLAGFLEADGSIYVRLKPNTTYRYGFQIAPSIVFYQHSSERTFLGELQKLMNIGYLRDRNDGITELTIGDRLSIRTLIKWTMPYLRLKKAQANLMLEILNKSEQVKSASDFYKVAQLIDGFGRLNYSKRRSINAQRVYHSLVERGLLTP